MLCIVKGRQKQASGCTTLIQQRSPSPENLSHSRESGAGVSTSILGWRRHLTERRPSPVFQPSLSISSCCLDPTCCSQPCNPALPDDGSSLLQRRQQLKQIYCNELIFAEKQLTVASRHSDRTVLSCPSRASCLYIFDLASSACAGRFGEGPQIQHAANANTAPSCHHQDQAQLVSPGPSS